MTTEIIEPTNETEQDAHTRVIYAQLGSHVGATDTFLVALRARLYLWIANIDAELAKRAVELRQKQMRDADLADEDVGD